MNKTLIIAEAGVNHNGSIQQAKKLIDVAVDAGADIVKFQAFKADELVSKYAEKAQYQKHVTDLNESHHEMIRKLELDSDAHYDLMKYSKNNGIGFLSAPFDIDSIDMLLDLGLSLIKIPSGEIINMPYLEHIGKAGKSIIISTGMASLQEIEKAIMILVETGTDKNLITVLHCNTEYPTPMEDVNLRAMITIKDKLKVNVGYSDHSLGIEVPIAAVAMGAKIIEKHFTLDRTLSGPDHAASLEPNELKSMVSAIRNIELAIGNGVKEPSKSEFKNINIVRKSIVAKTKIKAGDSFSELNITTKRPGDGISPMKWHEIIGEISDRDYEKDDLIVG